VIIEPRKGPAATDAASARGEGVPVCKGKLVDIASIEQAGMVFRQAKMIAR
jgi:malyl-CoA/(S)-citramalyl-CoA lyase